MTILHVESELLKTVIKKAWHEVQVEKMFQIRLVNMPAPQRLEFLMDSIVSKVVLDLVDHIPVHRGPKGALHVQEEGALRDQSFCIALLGIVALWAEGAPVEFSQEDFDEVTKHVLLEGRMPNGNFMLGVRPKEEFIPATPDPTKLN